MRNNKRRIILGGILLLVAVYVYMAYDPAKSSWFPKCPFLVLTGLKCPGCGSQRAIHSLLHGDIGGAFAFNAILVLSLPLVAFLLYLEWVRKKRPRLYSGFYQPWTPLVLFAIFLGWGIARNIWDW